MTAKVVVIGVGNILLGDEGLGIVAVRRLEEELPEELSGEVEIVDGGTDSLDALIDSKEAEQVIVVDAIDGGKEPGTVISLDGEELLKTESVPLLSLHQLSLKESVCLAELTGFDRKKLLVVGMQPASIAPSENLSPVVNEKMELLVSRIKEEIQEVLR
ncbi:MAG: hydrogenase maturation protease [Planctomycetota bacterium]|nr:hydrogenase maturation protease [Planctomycetota bacterium]